METSDLRPCPFCGTIPSEVEPQERGMSGLFAVHCLVCAIAGASAETADEAVRHWNHRGKPPFPVQRLVLGEAEE